MSNNKNHRIILFTLLLTLQFFNVFAQLVPSTVSIKKDSELYSQINDLKQQLSDQNVEKNREIWSNLATIYEQLGDYFEAASAYTQAALLTSSDLSSKYTLGKARSYLFAGDVGSAQEILNNLLQTGIGILDEKTFAEVKLLNIWCDIAKAPDSAAQAKNIALLRSYVASDSMATVRPAALYTLWWLSGDDQIRIALERDHPNSPEAALLGKDAALMPSAIWFLSVRKPPVVPLAKTATTPQEVTTPPVSRTNPAKTVDTSITKTSSPVASTINTAPPVSHTNPAKTVDTSIAKTQSSTASTVNTAPPVSHANSAKTVDTSIAQTKPTEAETINTIPNPIKPTSASTIDTKLQQNTVPIENQQIPSRDIADSIVPDTTKPEVKNTTTIDDTSATMLDPVSVDMPKSTSGTTDLPNTISVAPPKPPASTQKAPESTNATTNPVQTRPAETASKTTNPPTRSAKAQQWQQVGLFREESNARRLVDQLVSKGFKSEILYRQKEGIVFFVVAVRDPNNTMKVRLKNAGFECYTIIE